MSHHYFEPRRNTSTSALSLQATYSAFHLVTQVDKYHSVFVIYWMPRKTERCLYREDTRLPTLRLITATRSSRCLEAFHCSSTVAGGQLQSGQTGASCLYRLVSLVAFSRLNCCGADPWTLAAIGVFF